MKTKLSRFDFVPVSCKRDLLNKLLQKLAKFFQNFSQYSFVVHPSQDLSLNYGLPDKDIIPQIMIFEVNFIDIFNCIDYWIIFLCYLALIF
jgi:hypothetical protein